jgi:hypothetical protein
MGKVVLTVTIDAHLDQWIKQKGGMKSRIVNTILHDAWINEGQKKPRPRAKSMHNQGILMIPPLPSANGVTYQSRIPVEMVEKRLEEGWLEVFE